MIDIDGYRYLEAAQGEQRAFEWIESRVPPAWRGPVSEVIYWKGHHELLWSLVPDDFSKASHRDAVWFMRAMTLAVGRAYTDDRLRRARQYLSEGGETRYADFGRVVLGLASVESLSQRPVGDRALVETTYALAVRAVADGRPRDALRWFHACAAAGERYRGQVEYKWAREVLARAAVGGRPETLLQRHGADYFMPWGVEGLSVRR